MNGVNAWCPEGGVAIGSVRVSDPREPVARCLLVHFGGGEWNIVGVLQGGSPKLHAPSAADTVLDPEVEFVLSTQAGLEAHAARVLERSGLTLYSAQEWAGLTKFTVLATSDTDAHQKASDRANGSPVAVWQQGRLVPNPNRDTDAP